MPKKYSMNRMQQEAAWEKVQDQRSETLKKVQHENATTRK